VAKPYRTPTSSASSLGKLSSCDEVRSRKTADSRQSKVNKENSSGGRGGGSGGGGGIGAAAAAAAAVQPKGDKIGGGDGTSSSDYGYATGLAAAQPPASNILRNQENVSSTSSNDDQEERKRKVTPHTNLQKPRPKKPVMSAAEKRELKRRMLIKRAKSQRMKVRNLINI